MIGSTSIQKKYVNIHLMLMRNSFQTESVSLTCIIKANMFICINLNCDAIYVVRCVYDSLIGYTYKQKNLYIWDCGKNPNKEKEYIQTSS